MPRKTRLIWQGLAAFAIALIPVAPVQGAPGSHASQATTWGKALPIPGLSALSAKQTQPSVTAISCPAPGSCAAGGYFATNSDPSNPNDQGFLADEVHGSWSRAFEIPGLGSLNVDHYGRIVESVSCSSAGNCAAVGDYTTAAAEEGFIVSELHGRWGMAKEVPGLASLTADGGNGGVQSVSCPAVG